MTAARRGPGLFGGSTLRRLMVRFGLLAMVRDLWRSARRPAIFRRCALIALGVGTLLTVVNQLDVITGARADSSFMLRVAANYLIPFVVSNLGAMSSLSAER